MKFVFFTNSVSAHQLPLAYELVARLGADHYRYVYTGETQHGGQDLSIRESWIVQYDAHSDAVRELLETSDVLLVGGLRPVDLIERRLGAGKWTLYYSERWFKPWRKRLGWRLFGCSIGVPGWMRLLVPGYRKMARRFARMFESDHFRFLAVGPWALADMKKIVGTILGKSSISLVEWKHIPWGYFVEPSRFSEVIHRAELKVAEQRSGKIRLLWVGRMLDWKRVDTIVRAVRPLATDRFALTLVGDGPEKERLVCLAKGASNIVFRPPVKIEGVRSIMREHDVYILSSNAQEGWGAALNEALEEGMTCLGTYEAGSSAALLPSANLFHAGDWRSLSQLLAGLQTEAQRPQTTNVKLSCGYTPSGAADKLMEFLR